MDFRFRKADDLKRLYPALLRHAITTFGSPDVLRFLGKRVRRDGQVPQAYQGELFSDIKQRPEGFGLSTTWTVTR